MSANPKKTISITFRTEPEKRETLDRIAALQDRDRSYILNEAIEAYIQLYDWQLAQIDRGLAAADAGEFASEDDIAAAIARWQP